MWTKRNNHALKSERVDFLFKHMSKKGNFERKKNHVLIFFLSHRKTCQTMSMDNVDLKICLLGTSNSMVTLIVFSWCEPKWSRDEFNNQSQIL